MKAKSKHVLLLLLAGFIFSECSHDDTLSETKLTNVSATVVKGCFDFARPDSFSIVLANYPTGVFDVYPAGKIPDAFRINGLEVLISGEISQEKVTNQCSASPNAKFTGTNIITITSIQKRN